MESNELELKKELEITKEALGLLSNQYWCLVVTALKPKEIYDLWLSRAAELLED